MFRCKSLIASILLLVATFPIIIPWHSAQGEQSLASITLSLPKAHAIGGPGMAAAMAGTSTFENTAERFFAKILELFVVLNWFALMAVQTLLDPDTIFGVPVAGVRYMEVILNLLWVFSRDIVNAIFAFMLLAGGVYLIVSGEGVESFLKQRMPKFVLAVVLVNFSWFFPRVIIDAAHVLSAAIYQLPLLVTRDGGGNLFCVGGPGPNKVMETPFGGPIGGDDEECRYVYRVVLFPTQREECQDDGDPATPLPADCTRPVPPDGQQFWGLIDIYYVPWKNFVQGGHQWTDHTGTSVNVYPSGADAVINGLAVNFAKIPLLGTIDFQQLVAPLPQGASAQRAAAYAQYFINLALHVILSVAVGLALLAFAVVLVVRMGVLWLCIAFMPFIFVGYAWGKGLGELGEQGGGFNLWKKFISYAFLPAFVAIPFAVGFTLVSQLYYVAALPDVVRFQNLNLMSSINHFHHILWLVISVMIIWKGVFMVLESKDDFAKGIVGAIKGIGTTGLRIATQSITYAPFIPTSGGKTTSIGEISERARGLAYRGGVWPLFHPKEQEGAPTTPPPPREDIIKATGGMTENQFKELKDILNKVNERNAPEQLNRFAEALSRSSGLGKEQARAIAVTPEAMRVLAEQAGRQKVTITGGEIATAQGHWGTGAAPTQVTFGDSNFKMDIDETVKQDINATVGNLHAGVDADKPNGKITTPVLEESLKKLETEARNRGRTTKGKELDVLHDIVHRSGELYTQGKKVTKANFEANFKDQIPKELWDKLNDASIQQLVDLMEEANKREAAKPKKGP